MIYYAKRNSHIDNNVEEKCYYTNYQSDDSVGCSTPPEDDGFQILYGSGSSKHHCQHFDDFKQQFAIMQENINTNYKQNDDSGCSTPPEDEGFHKLYGKESSERQCAKALML